MSFQSLDITKLSDLLQSCSPNFTNSNVSDSDSEEDTKKISTLKNAGPGQIGFPKSSVGDNGDTNEKPKPEVPNKSEIWNPIEVAKKSDPPFAKDPRKTPQYEMVYRQSVTSEDIFLQMGNKTPSSSSCENLVVEIHLPQDDFNKIQLNLKEQAIDLRSPNHFLYLPLPHPINPKAGNAKWDRDTEKLTVTLKLARELDGVNF